MRVTQNGWHFPGDIFKCIFLNENVWISNTIWLNFVCKCQIDNITALVQITAWRQTGKKPLCEPMMAYFDDAYICNTWPRWIHAKICSSRALEVKLHIFCIKPSKWWVPCQSNYQSYSVIRRNFHVWIHQTWLFIGWQHRHQPIKC